MIIILIIIFLVIYILFGAMFENRIKNKLIRVIIKVILVSLIIPICVNLLMPFFQKEQLEKEEQFRTTVMNAIVEEKMSSEDIEGLIFNKYRDIFESSEKEAKLWANNFLATLPEKRVELESLSKKSEEYINKLSLKWKPICDLILKQFDDRINELIKRNENIIVEKKEYKLIMDIDSNKYEIQKVRFVEFANGNSIFISFEPARIQRGIITEGIEIVYFEQLKNGNTTCDFAIYINQDLYQISPRNNRNGYYESVGYRTTKNPIEDEHFRNKLSEALNKIISSAYLLE